jgi:hypothetical protein
MTRPSFGDRFEVGGMRETGMTGMRFGATQCDTYCSISDHAMNLSAVVYLVNADLQLQTMRGSPLATDPLAVRYANSLGDQNCNIISAFTHRPCRRLTCSFSLRSKVHLSFAALNQAVNLWC